MHPDLHIFAKMPQTLGIKLMLDLIVSLTTVFANWIMGAHCPGSIGHLQYLHFQHCFFIHFFNCGVIEYLGDVGEQITLDNFSIEPLSALVAKSFSRFK